MPRQDTQLAELPPSIYYLFYPKYTLDTSISDLFTIPVTKK
jgi:hypothetical protein